jgi:TPR repeat protein
MNLTGRSKRTLWRFIEHGLVIRGDNTANGKATIDLDSIRPYFLMQIDPQDFALIESADCGGGGDADAQNELALLFLANQQPASALYWLELAAGQGHTDAMHWLGRCHIEGNGLPKNEELGIMWLSKAAAHGHLISRYQMDRLYTLKT